MFLYTLCRLTTCALKNWTEQKLLHDYTLHCFLSFILLSLDLWLVPTIVTEQPLWMALFLWKTCQTQKKEQCRWTNKWQNVLFLRIEVSSYICLFSVVDPTRPSRLKLNRDRCVLTRGSLHTENVYMSICAAKSDVPSVSQHFNWSPAGKGFVKWFGPFVQQNQAHD